MRININDTELSHALAPVLAEMVAQIVAGERSPGLSGGVFRCAIDEAADQILARLLYGLRVESPSEYAESERKVWEGAIADVKSMREEGAFR